MRPQEQFAAEIATLRDQLTDAVRAGRQSTLEAGLGIFEVLVASLLQRTAEVDALMEGRSRVPPMWSQFMGRADRAGVGAIGEGLWPVMNEAVRCDSDPAFWATLFTTHAVLRTAWAADDLSSFRQFAGLIGRTVQELLDDARQTTRLPDIGRLSKSLSVAWNGFLGRGAEVDVAKVVRFSDVLIREHLGIARRLIDRKAVNDLRSWAESYESLFEMLDLRRFDGLDLRELLLARKQAGFLAVRAWVLFSEAEAQHWIDMSSEEARALWQALQPADLPLYTWSAVVLDANQRLSSELGWESWEVLSKPERSGAMAMTFEGYVADAALFELLSRDEAFDKVGQPVSSSLAPARNEDSGKVGRWDPVAELARSLKSRLEGGLVSMKVSATDVADVRRSEMSDRLAAIAAESDSRREEEIAESSLDLTRVERFIEAVVNALNQPDVLTASLPSCETAEDPDDATGLFGLNVLMSKDWFVDTNVHAEPSSLGEEFGRDVREAALGMLLDKITEAVPSKSVEEEHLHSEVQAAVAQIKNLGHPAVFVFDYRAWDRLRRQSSSAQHRDYDEPFDVDGAPCHLVHSRNNPGVLVASTEQLACYHRARISEKPENLRDSNRVLVSVDAVEPPRAAEIATAEIESGKVPAGDRAAEELRIRQQVHVQVFVKPATRVKNAKAGLLLRFPKEDDES